METRNNRRNFIKYAASFCTVFLVGCKLNTNMNNDSGAGNKKLKSFNLEEMGYCCAKCDESCEMLKATKHNDLDKKRRLAEYLSNEFKKPIPIEDIFCYGCKKEPYNTRTLQCTVWQCAKEKGLISCALCNDLSNCDKELWEKWPSIKARTLKVQKEMNL